MVWWWKQRKFLIYFVSSVILSLICLIYFLIIVHISTNINFQTPNSGRPSLLKMEGLLVASEEKNQFFPTKKFIPLDKVTNSGVQIKNPPSHRKKLVQGETKMACHVPHLDPFDSSILDHVRTPKNIKCTKKFPLLFKSDVVNQSNFGQPILITLDSPRKFGYKDCCHLSFRHDKANKNLSCIPITKNITNVHRATEYVKIQCTHAATNGTVIVDILAFVPVKSTVKKRIEKIVNGSSQDQVNYKVNVVILGLDSVSHLNFLRTMPKTEKFLTKNLSAFKMIGYSKVGDNTFPNLVPVLLGKSVEELTSLCWNTSLHFDSCNFIWKNFERQNYLTFYGEDNPWISMFRYGKKGFKESPTDYDLSSVTRVMDKHFGHTLELHDCYGPRLAFEVLLEYLKMTARSMELNFGRDQKYFQFVWENSLTHEKLNAPKLGDAMLQKFLKWFKTEGHLQSTVLILMSDHGMRFNGIRTTFQGKIEESMPFLYFVMPDWFQNKYGRAMENLKLNEKRLTTPFDLHKTLRDLLLPDNIEEDRLQRRELKLINLEREQNDSKLPRGISLFLPIPLGRTCSDAEIKDNWCVCGDMAPVPSASNNSLVTEAAEQVVTFVNEMFQNYPQCSILTLDKILNAQVWRNDAIDMVEMINDFGKNNFTNNMLDVEIKLFLAITVKPSDATFETTVTRFGPLVSGVIGNWTMGGGEISRINTYGTQSHCVDDYRLKKFCFCSENDYVQAE